MARRLTLAGMRPISNVVDVTNYVLLERGQPLHAFDLDRLRGRGTRGAARGATARRITTLDGVERTLTAEDLLVCDADRRPQAIAGIMGGAEAEVHDGTTEILLEAAYFQPMGISRSSKRLGLRSESSARFERGIDPNGVLAGSDRVRRSCSREVAGAPVAPEPIDVYPVPVDRGADPRARPRGSRRCSALELDADAGEGRAAPARHRDRGAAATATFVGDRADVPARPRARDRHRRGGRPPGRPQRDPADAAAHDRAVGGGLTPRQRDRRRDRRRARRHRAAPRR